MERLTRDQIARIFNQEELKPEEVLQVIEKELGIKIDSSLPKEAQVDEVFRIYTETMDKLDEKRIEQEEVYNTHKKKKKEERFTRKDYIQELISQGKYTKGEIVKMTDDYFSYDEGKTSRSRVGRVIRELTHDGKIKQDSSTKILSLT